MYPRNFEYFAPGSIAEAIGLLKKHGEEAKILSGGHSLLPLMKLRLATPGFIVDINNIAGLNRIEEKDGFLRIGALVREAELEESPVLARYPLLRDTAKTIADPQVRNRATVCGNLAHGDPANDHPATMLAYDAQVVAEGPKGERTIAVKDFFVDTLTTALKPDEILKEVRIPVPPARSGGAYLKLERKVGDFAVAAVAVQITLDAKGVCTKAGIGLTNVGPKPIKATAAEAALLGKPLTDAAMAEAANLAGKASDPATDLRAPADYKRSMVRELTQRALKRAKARAEGGK